MSADAALSTRLAVDTRSLDGLKARAQAQPEAALKQAATQFEAVFMNMLLKSMRESLPQDGPFASDTTRTYTTMLDQQLAQKMAEQGTGLADLIVKQLARHPSVSGAAGATGATGAPGAGAAKATQTNGAGRALVPPALTKLREATDAAGASGAPQAFVDRLLPDAHAAEAATGVPARFILGQAALESGWGRHEIRSAGGQPSHNLFGIKASRNWTGKTVDVMTTEYVDGVPKKMVQKFRAYDSYADAFKDWAQLMTANPRYRKVLEAGRDAAGFANGLQQAGYATDPRYAEKLTRVLNSALLRQSFA